MINLVKHILNMTFVLRLEDVPLQWKNSVTLQNKTNIPYPILSSKQLRYRFQHQPLKPISTTLTKEKDSLQKKLLNESKKTMELNKLFCRLQEQQWTSRHQSKAHHRTKHRQRKKKRRHKSSSSSDSEGNNDSSSSESSSY
ncbi:unnamed protein product [Torque teno mini virus 6]|uniref:DUF755 domain-containing protein n=1 Tax=Torque teno mini virus 6 TaxID=687374 RepID=Q9QU35_9VIRU|nr:hypothetical protein TTMV6_gp3 [Torque teno mini virus 6]BAA86946.1 unnamed protein product [Torque teno mini virus 6]